MPQGQPDSARLWLASALYTSQKAACLKQSLFSQPGLQEQSPPPPLCPFSCLHLRKPHHCSGVLPMQLQPLLSHIRSREVLSTYEVLLSLQYHFMPALDCCKSVSETSLLHEASSLAPLGWKQGLSACHCSRHRHLRQDSVLPWHHPEVTWGDEAIRRSHEEQQGTQHWHWDLTQHFIACILLMLSDPDG